MLLCCSLVLLLPTSSQADSYNPSTPSSSSVAWCLFGSTNYHSQSAISNCSVFSTPQAACNHYLTLDGFTYGGEISFTGTNLSGAPYFTCTRYNNVGNLTTNRRWVIGYPRPDYEPPISCPSAGTPVDGSPIEGCGTELIFEQGPCYWDESLTCLNTAGFQYTGNPIDPNDDPFTNPTEPTDPNFKNCYDSNGNFAGSISNNLTCPSNLPPVNVCANCFGGDPTDPTDPTNPTDPTDPTDPIDPTNPDNGGGSTGGGSTGGGDGSNDGDGEGTDEGEGECDPTKEDCGTEFSVTSVCYEPFKCDGDSFACHIAFTQHQQYCQTKEQLDYLEDLPQSIEQVLSDHAQSVGMDQTLSVSEQITEELDINAEGWFDGFISSLANPSGRSGSCPPDRSVSVLGTNVSFSWSFICDMAESARPLVLAAVTFLCSFMLVSAVFGVSLRGR